MYGIKFMCVCFMACAMENSTDIWRNKSKELDNVAGIYLYPSVNLSSI